MCGIVGYTGSRKAAPILMEGLAKLEYRGYDSAGIAVRDGDGSVKVFKTKGRLKALADKLEGQDLEGNCGIGHTRWATHGEPSDVNAHPLWSDDMNLTGVHNGIFENYQEAKAELMKLGYTFASQTDTEVAVKLIDHLYKKYAQGPLDAIARAMRQMRGSYALVLMFRDYPGEIWVARKDSPLIVGMGKGENFVASDVPAILKHTRSVCYIGNLEIARVARDGVEFYDVNERPLHKEPAEITWDAEAAEKDGYEHFMLKEIHEQPRAVRDTIASALRDGKVDLDGAGLTEEAARKVSQLYIVACGSAYHAGVAAQYVIEGLSGLPVRVELASEFRYREMPLDRDALAVIISQSGETADSLAALRKARENGIRTLAIVNVVGSSIAREADNVFYTLAGPEIAVATTKAYSAQLAAGYLLAIRFAQARGTLTGERYAALVAGLQALPAKIQQTLDLKDHVQRFAVSFAKDLYAFFIGRGIDYAAAMEGSLKVKEISYIHSEAYAAGELKHGTISLIEDGTLVVGILTQDALVEKTLSNMLEVKSRGACLMAIAAPGHSEIQNSADFTFLLPETDVHFAASLAAIPLQLMGYYFSVARGLDVDKPRNLAKSVTVE